MNETPLSALTYADFAAHLHSKFAVRSGGEGSVQAELELVQADLQPSPRGAAGECFSVVFAGPVNPLLAQAIYRFEHADLGRFSLFIVPIGQDAKRTCYEAVFNRCAAE